MSTKNWKRITRSYTVYKKKKSRAAAAIQDEDLDGGSTPLVENIMNAGNNEIKSMEGYEKVSWKVKLYHVLCVLTLFGVYFIAKRFRKVFLFLTCKKTALRFADTVLIEDAEEKYHIEKVKKMTVDEAMYSNTIPGLPPTNDEGANKGSVEYRWFEFLYLRYIYDAAMDSFVVQRVDPQEILCSESTTKKCGLSSEDHRRRLIQFGANHIAVKTGGTWKNILKEVLTFINLFQMMVIILWMIRGYEGYAIACFVMVMGSVLFSATQLNQSLKVLKGLVSSAAREVRVIRDGESFMAGSAGLVPGDLVEITGRFTLPCDLILLSGTVEVDESTITGDTVAAQKTAFVAPKENKFTAATVQQMNQLIGGSKVLGVKPAPGDDAALAVVYRTGFSASKGNIIRSVILAQRNNKRHPYIVDVERFAQLMVVVGIVSMVLTATYFCARPDHVSIFSSWNITDMLLISVPPYLSLIYSFPIFVAKRRLKGAEVSATNVLDLMKFGLLDCVCYDKTGTLTEATLGLHGVLEQHQCAFAPITTETTQMSADVVNIMAACHNLVRVNDQVCGDKLEEELFIQAGYELKREKAEPHFIVHPPPVFNDRGMINVTNIFPFSPQLRRMAVVTRFPDFCAYSKGSPKSIKSICSEKTIPADFEEIVKRYGLKGFRIIAIAKKKLSEELFFSSMKREDVEKDMEFLGFFIMKNKLHPETIGELTRIQQTKIRTPMITGDTIYSAISVAKECSIINPMSRVLIAEVEEENQQPIVVWKEIAERNTDRSDANTELAMTGPAFSLLRNFQDAKQRAMYYKLLVRCNVFSEMLPSQKAELISDLQSMNYIVGMVGDGSNDSMALSTADVGLSISEAETSFAAQLTSETRHCMSYLIMDSRALLDKILNNFQFVAVCVFLNFCVILNGNLRGYGGYQIFWIYQAVAGLTTITMSFSNPTNQLHKQRPPKSIMRFSVMLSILGQIAIQYAFLFTATYLMDRTDWFREYSLKPGTNPVHLLESYSFLYSNFQFFSLVVTYNLNYQYITPFKNIGFLLLLLVIMVCNLLILWPFPSFSLPDKISFESFRYVPADMFSRFKMYSNFHNFPSAESSYMFQRAFALVLVFFNMCVSFGYQFLLRHTVNLVLKLRRSHASGLMYRRLAASIPSMKHKLY